MLYDRQHQMQAKSGLLLKEIKDDREKITLSVIFYFS